MSLCGSQDKTLRATAPEWTLGLNGPNVGYMGVAEERLTHPHPIDLEPTFVFSDMMLNPPESIKGYQQNT